MAVPHRLLAAVGLFLACMGASNVGRAYSSPEAFAAPAYEAGQSSAGGGGGRWFTGSPADGYSCSVCHLPGKAPREFPLYAAGVPSVYNPLVPQQITLFWPQFAQRWTELRPIPGVPPAAGQPIPAVGLLTELVAESGMASGTIEIALNTAAPEELCERARPNLAPRLGVRVYQVHPGVEPKLIRANDQGIVRCEAQQLGHRCLVAVIPCGAKQLRFTWTPPATQTGPIWFSAGYVATDASSGTPDLDSVQELVMPIQAAALGGAAYEETLRSGCALVPARPRAGSFPWSLGFVALAWFARRARSKERHS